MKRPVYQTARKDSLGRRLPNLPQSTGKKVRLTPNDLQNFQFYLRHGDLPVSFVHEFLRAKKLANDYQSTVKRHGVLFHENNTPHKGAYLDRDPNQWKALNSGYNVMVYRLTKFAKRALRDEGMFIENTPVNSNSWKHDFMRACYSASIEIACLREPKKYEYISHDQIVDRIGKNSFMPAKRKINGKMVTVNQLRPDLMYGVRYLQNDSVRLFLVEIDCKTEQVNSTEKNSHPIKVSKKPETVKNTSSLIAKRS